MIALENEQNMQFPICRSLKTKHYVRFMEGVATIQSLRKCGGIAYTLVLKRRLLYWNRIFDHIR